MSQAMGRGRWYGMLQILRYNWPLYLATWASSALAVLATRRLSWWPLRWMVGAYLLGGLGWSTTSLAVAHWVYDLSELGWPRWSWLGDLSHGLRADGRVLNLHAGVDETAGAIQRAFPAGRHLAADFFDPVRTPTSSIRRAREQELSRAIAAPLRVDCIALPFAEATWDTVLLVFAAHELREAWLRERCFAELRRVLAADGSVVLIEHLRDVPNLLAFGPGVFHWYSRRTWLEAAQRAGLELSTERRITPFVHALVLRRA